ncbi:ChaN family lipoprotein [Candidatus Woesearchaeota archaeon]|nr:ChaN family lipoprotein [Candidatus Woesearchaeota archaeon]
MSFRDRVYQEYRRAYREIWGRSVFFKGEDEITSGFRQYEREFRQEVRSPCSLTSLDEIITTAKQSEIVYLGDFHSLRQSKLELINIINKVKDAPAAMAMEDFFVQEQKPINDYLCGKIDRQQLRERTRHGNGYGKSSWRGVIAILDYAQKEKMPVYGLDVKGRFRQRDKRYAFCLDHFLNDHNQLFVIAGDFHLARAHLPSFVQQKRKVSDVVVFQGIESAFWQLLREGQAQHPAVRIAERTYSLNTVPPLLKALVWANATEWKEDQKSSAGLQKVHDRMLHSIVRRAIEVKGRAQKVSPKAIENIAYSVREREEALQMYMNSSCPS